MEPWTLHLLDELIDSCGRYTLTALAPQIVRSRRADGLNEREQVIVSALHRDLSPIEWQRLPELIASRHPEKLRKAEERAAREEQIRREAGERAAHERERLQREAAQAARKTALISEFKALLASDFLSAETHLMSHPDAVLVRKEELDDLKANFVLDWVRRELKHPMDREQAAAVAATHGDVQVVARAGSGKTRTLITRAIFLQKHCRVSPRELLLLAFNKKAADEMKTRLVGVLGDDLPHVMTFHALAHALVHPEQELLSDDRGADQMGLSREVQEVIDEHVRSPEHVDRIRDLMLTHFRDDWERIINGRFELTIDEFLAYRRELPRESLRGDYVKSYGEKVIANALFEHGVEYQYERNFRWGGLNYRPDFTIPVGTSGGVVIEYFGMEGDADYDEMSEEKRVYWAARNEWKLLALTPSQLARLGVERFVDALLRRLREAGVAVLRRSEEDIWELVKRRALDSFTSAMKTFVGRCRKYDLSPAALETKIRQHRAISNAEGLFLEAGASIYRSYLQRLTAQNKDDFDGLMWRAAEVVRNGQTRFVRDRGREQGDLAGLRFVMVDEFQDFSQMFLELMVAIRSSSPRAQFFCVGDDWQAINAFAGSELRFFTEFSKHFQDTSQRYIRTNYRSARSIVEASNAIMRGKGAEAQAKRSDGGEAWICKLDQFVPSAYERERHDGDEITPAVLRLVWTFLGRGMDVVLLSRQHRLPWFVRQEGPSIGADALSRFLELVRSCLPKDDRGRVTANTVHGYKGLEKSAVIVLDAVQRSFPLIHPTWIFLRVFGDTIGRIEDEERRLFYVAATRARDSLALVTEASRESPYVLDIQRNPSPTPFSWNDVLPIPSVGGPHFEIRVLDGHDVKDQLKDLNYSWNSSGRYWQRSVPAEGFSFQALLSQAWAANGYGIEVYSESGAMLHQRRRGGLS